MSHTTHTVIANRFRQFNREMKAHWETFSVIDFYLPRLHNQLKEGHIQPLELKILGFSPKAQNQTVFDKNNTYGTLHRTLQAVPRSVFVDSIVSFEGYITDLMAIVYRQYPARLRGDGSEPSVREVTLMEIVLASLSRDEIIEHLIEERTRSIFYGNPIDVFSRDKARLEFKTYFTEKHSQAIEQLQEVIARRNIIIHNQGAVDRKYLRETRSSSARLGQKLGVDGKYLRNSLYLLRGIGACAAKLIIENIFNKPATGRVARQGIKDSATYERRKSFHLYH
jgi:hypothetical protein